ncbi:hypothetical protein AOLI_G00244250 [Acnodon oligacanthus]
MTMTISSPDLSLLGPVSCWLSRPSSGPRRRAPAIDRLSRAPIVRIYKRSEGSGMYAGMMSEETLSLKRTVCRAN